jgi:hypothetical protein
MTCPLWAWAIQKTQSIAEKKKKTICSCCRTSADGDLGRAYYFIFEGQLLLLLEEARRRAVLVLIFFAGD